MQGDRIDNPKWQRGLAWGIRVVLGLVFIYASVHKILAPDQFALVLFGYGVFPGNMINIMAITVPFVELISGACLILGWFRRSALILINAMLTVFVLLISVNLIRGHEFDCGCFSFGQTTASSAVELLIRDLLMLGAGLFLWRCFKKATHWPESRLA